MKKIVAAGAILASVAAFATTVESSNTFGVMKIDDTTTAELIIGVPWAAVGTGNIKVTDLVLPTNTGDQLYWYDTAAETFYVWTVANGAWVPDENTDLDSGTQTGATTTALARGDALIIKRTVTPFKTVYLSGQYAGASATATTTIVGPTEEQLAQLSNRVIYTLIANPNATAVNLNVEGRFTGTPNNGDRIILSDGTTYGYDEDGWYKWTKASEPGTTPFIPATKVYSDVSILSGQGAWYLRKGAGGNITINW